MPDQQTKGGNVDSAAEAILLTRVKGRIKVRIERPAGLEPVERTIDFPGRVFLANYLMEAWSTVDPTSATFTVPMTNFIADFELISWKKSEDIPVLTVRRKH